MPKLIIKAYDALIHSEWYDEGCNVLIGVVDDNLPQEAYDADWWADEKIYYYLTNEEFAELKAGDVLNDGEDFTVTEIDKENPSIFEVEYDLENVSD